MNVAIVTVSAIAHGLWRTCAGRARTAGAIAASGETAAAIL